MATRRRTHFHLLLAALGSLILAQGTNADPINWRQSLDTAKIEAGRTGKLILLHFYTSSCGPCKKLERDVFSQPQIATSMEQNFVPVKINADTSPALANAYQVTRVPFEVVLTSQGNVIQQLNCPLDPNSYGTQLINVAQHYNSRNANRMASAQSPINSAYAGLKIGQANQASQSQPAAPAAPAVTQNPYFNSAPSAPPQQAATVGQRPPVAPTAPPAVQPQRYENRYAQVTPTTPPVSQTPQVQPPATPPASPPIAQSPVTPTMPPVAAVTPKTESRYGQTTPNQAATPATPPVVTAPAVVAEAWPPALPPGTPELAFDGYCPVSLRESKKWVRGKKSFGAIHRGRTYLFASDAHRQKFLASAAASDSYSPVFSGHDPVKLLEENQQVAGQRKFGFEYRNAFYLFSSQETMERFARQPDRYSAGVRQAMTRMDGTASGTVRR